MNISEPTGKDIAELLLLFAPKNYLEDLELSKDTIDDFIEFFNECHSFYKDDLIALAMYFAHKKFFKLRQNYSLLEKFYISPIIIHKLITFSELDGYKDGENIFKEIRSKNARKNAKKAHLEDYSLRKEVITYYENNIDFFKKANGKNKSAAFVASYMIDNKIVPVEYRTIADWIRDYRKAKENKN